MPWDFTTAPTSRHLRFRLTFQGVTVQPYASGASDSASQPKQLRFCLSVPAVSTLPHNPSSYSPSTLNSASQPKQLQSQHSASQPRQSQLRLTFQAVTFPAFCLSVPALATPPHNPSSLNPGDLNSASRSKQSHLHLTARYR